MAYPDLLAKAQRRYAGTRCRIHRVIGDAAFDADALRHFTEDRAVQPVFAPHTRPAPAQLSAAAVAAGIRLGPDYRPICATDRLLVSHDWARELVSVNFRGTRYDQIGLPYRSPPWDAVYAQRTSVERANSLWESGGVKAARHRRRYVWYSRLVIAALAQPGSFTSDCCLAPTDLRESVIPCGPW